MQREARCGDRACCVWTSIRSRRRTVLLKDVTAMEKPLEATWARSAFSLVTECESAITLK